MATFEDRGKGIEAGFMHELELRFKITSRRNYMAGLWAAKHMGLTGEAADTYAKSVVLAELDRGGDKNVIEKMVADLTAKGHQVTAAQVQFELEHFAATAKKQVMQE
jgi:hypothetical protein